MALGPRLDLRQHQTLVMTPQLRQAIKLLQYSNIEVATFVEEELERNPLLERDDSTETPASQPDLFSAVLIGAALSALVTLPLALPLKSNAHDLGLLFGLGVVQLAIPCLLLVRVSRALPAPEVALLGLLEVIFGVLWAWLGAGRDGQSLPAGARPPVHVQLEVTEEQARIQAAYRPDARLQPPAGAGRGRPAAGSGQAGGASRGSRHRGRRGTPAARRTSRPRRPVHDHS